MCSAPVTFGGGMTMVKGGLSDLGSGLKKPHRSHLQVQCQQNVQACTAVNGLIAINHS